MKRVIGKSYWKELLERVIGKPNILLITLIAFFVLISLFFYQSAQSTVSGSHKLPLEGIALHGFSSGGEAGVSQWIDVVVNSSGQLVVVGAGTGGATQVEGRSPGITGQPENPVNISGVFETTPVSVTDTQLRELAITNQGDLRTASSRRHTGATVNAGNNAITADTTLKAAATNLRFIGFTIRESAATAASATVIIRHGVVAAGNCTGNEIAYIELNPNQSSQTQYPNILAVPSGICADVLAGTIDIATQTVVEANP